MVSLRTLAVGGPARAALVRLRRAYHEQPAPHRPDPGQPVQLVALLSLPDLAALVGARLWPLSPEAAAWLARPPRRRPRPPAAPAADVPRLAG